MSRPLRELKGVGEKTEKLFGKVGVRTTGELLRYYPRNYELYEEPAEIGSAAEGKVISVRGTVVSGVYVNQVRKLQVITLTIADASGRLPVAFFNAPYLKSVLKKGSVYIFRGKVVRKQGKLTMEHPEIFTPAAYEEIIHSMQPVYGLTAGLSNKTITKLVHQVLEEEPLRSEFLPEELRERYQLSDDNFALTAIHFPENKEVMLTARKRLVFDEFLLFILAVQTLKEKTEKAENAFPMKPVWATEQIIENLPYRLTNAQTNVWHEVERDLCGHPLMSRLIQGDVGSGKTILAFLAMILTVENGYQAALMVPTEVLARQHYEAFTALLNAQNQTQSQTNSADKTQEQDCRHPISEKANYDCAKDSDSVQPQNQQTENTSGIDISHIHPVLLTGSTTAKEKREIYARIASGEANVIIGTHALIQEKVTYKDLGLVITDEQHRFGVKQREALTTRGNPPHVLVMSATPIPRTLAIILYGDLDISILDELPAHRLPIKNCVVNTSWRPNAYSFMEKQVRLGRQVYVICPMVEESEGADGENVLDYTQKLRDTFPSDITVGTLHGKMKPKEKNSVMEDFASGKIQILVSTTVVEVGVNVPNATVMLVENAERFGLAQLHQLRGRVGRGEYQSYCIFMQGNEEEETSKRLQILNKSNDGFFIAGEDLKLRGPGDLFGIRQSGLMEFRLGDIYNDADVLKAASEAAGEILSLDPDLSLPQHENLKKRLSDYMRDDLQNLSL